MSWRNVTYLLVIFLCFQKWTPVSAKQRKTLDDFLNTCIDSKKHKTKPGPEDDLFKQCSPWKTRSCCTKENTIIMHNKSILWHNFNMDHSGRLSDKCREQFLQDLCFYECSPNTGPWLQEVKMKIRNEKYFNVPLCKSECDNWWNACQNDMTCLDNWGKGFNWSSGVNVCPTGSVNKTFKETFGNAKTFCEQVWNYSWKVVPDSKPCMKIWFTGSNPNDEIAKMKAMTMVSASTCYNYTNAVVFLLFLISLILS